MKKLALIMMVAAAILTFGVAAYAANTVQVTLTSPTITKSGCEKVGSVTFAFESGSVLQVGDWWYMDLPNGVSICRANVNYVIAGGNAGITFNAAAPGNAVFAAAGDSVADGAGNTILAASVGPVVGVVTGNAANVNAAVRAGANMAIRVFGALNSRRVTLTVIGDGGAGVGTLTVQPGYAMNIKILDGAQHNAAAAAGDTMIVLDTNSNNVYGDNGATDVITNAVPAPENTLCVNAQQMSGDLMFTSFASLNDKFTFTGDSQIAHTAAANVISLVACKGVQLGNIQIAAQNNCSFDYELATSYCATDTFSTQPVQYKVANGGNLFMIQGAGTFGNAGDQYQIYLFSDTPGVYFTAAPALEGFTPAQTACTTVLGGGNAIAAAWTAYNEAGAVSAAYAPVTCTVPSATRIREVRSATFTGIDTYNTIRVNIPVLSYDTAVIGNGTEITIRVSFRQYPCGELFSGSRKIGTFVTTCPPAAATTSLLFPFFPPMNGSIPGWWGGFVIVNTSAAAGTAAVTFWEADGDTATLTTPSIAAGGMWNCGAFSTLLTQVTPAAANAGTFGDANFAVTAVCNFTNGGGFAFTGNGNEGTGYTAYVRPGSGWN